MFYTSDLFSLGPAVCVNGRIASLNCLNDFSFCHRLGWGGGRTFHILYSFSYTILLPGPIRKFLMAKFTHLIRQTMTETNHDMSNLRNSSSKPVAQTEANSWNNSAVIFEINFFPFILSVSVIFMQTSNLANEWLQLNQFLELSTSLKRRKPRKKLNLRATKPPKCSSDHASLPGNWSGTYQCLEVHTFLNSRN